MGVSRLVGVGGSPPSRRGTRQALAQHTHTHALTHTHTTHIHTPSPSSTPEPTLTRNDQASFSLSLAAFSNRPLESPFEETRLARARPPRKRSAADPQRAPHPHRPPPPHHDGQGRGRRGRRAPGSRGSSRSDRRGRVARERGRDRHELLPQQNQRARAQHQGQVAQPPAARGAAQRAQHAG